MEFEESSTKYEELAQSLQRESQHREVLVNLLEDGDVYYKAALKEASIIANVRIQSNHCCVFEDGKIVLGFFVTEKIYHGQLNICKSLKQDEFSIV